MLSVRSKIELIQKSVKDIKEEIQQVTAVIAERIKHVEEEYKVETNDECYSLTDLSLPQAEAKLTYKKYFKKNVQYLKWNKCDYVGETVLFINRHINTKHILQNREENKINLNKIAGALDGIENIKDLFQLEVLGGEQIYVCNVCDNGFDNEDKIKKHIMEDYKEIIVKINKDIENI